ncbi:hypothetical protein [Nonomuraea sp. NPDC050643]
MVLGELRWPSTAFSTSELELSVRSDGNAEETNAVIASLAHLFP